MRPGRTRALGLIQEADFGLSTQVYQEFYARVTRRIAKPLTHSQAVAFLEEFRAFPIVLIDYALVLEGIEASLEYQVSCWDGAILAAAQALGCRILYSEDFNHGRMYGSLRAVNPFLGGQ